MKTKERRTLDIPEGLAEHMTGVQLEYERASRTGNSDMVRIHIIQPDGAEQHRYSDFQVVDDDERVVSFLRSNHDRPDPYRMALLGLNLAGWETNKEWELDQTDTYRDEAELLRSGGLSHLATSEDLDSFGRFVAEDMAARMFVMASIYEFAAENDESLTERFEAGGAAEALDSFELTADAVVGDAALARFKDYLKAWASDEAPEAIGGLSIRDERTNGSDTEYEPHE